MAEEKTTIREQYCSVHRVIDYGQTNIIFGKYPRSSDDVAREVAELIQKSFLRITPLERVSEASLIINVQLRDSTAENMLPTQCIVRMAIDQLDRPGAKEDIRKWKTMRRAARSISELLDWSNSYYNSGENPIAPTVLVSGVIRPVDRIWTFDDLSVMQLRTEFGCVLVSFQVNLKERDVIKSRQISLAMLQAIAVILKYTMRDEIVKIGSTFLMAQANDPSWHSRKIANKLAKQWLSETDCRQ